MTTKTFQRMCSMKHMLLCYALLLTACQGEEKRTMSLPEVEFIEKFDNEFSLESEPAPFDEMGIRGIKIIDDSLLIVGGSSWSFISLNQRRRIGRCLSSGQGPDEFYYVPYPTMATFYRQDNTLWGLIPDPTKKRIMQMNVTKFIQEQKLSLRPIPSKHLRNECWGAIPIDTTSFMMTTYDDETHTHLVRLMVCNDSLVDIPNMNILNEGHISDSYRKDINIIAKVSQYNQKRKRVAECMIYLNQINLYSIDSDWGKTLCIGKELTSIPAVERKIKFLKKEAYCSMTAWDEGFGGVWIGRDMKSFQMNTGKCPELHFFDWDGHPLAKVTLDRYINCFDIDFERKVLYAVDAKEDIIVSYPAEQIIDILRKK